MYLYVYDIDTHMHMCRYTWYMYIYIYIYTSLLPVPLLRARAVVTPAARTWVALHICIHVHSNPRTCVYMVYVNIPIYHYCQHMPISRIPVCLLRACAVMRATHSCGHKYKYIHRYILQPTHEYTWYMYTYVYITTTRALIACMCSDE